MESLNVYPPDIQPHATDYIVPMIKLISKNIINGKAYFYTNTASNMILHCVGKIIN